MKTGRSLNEIVQELARQQASKRDFLADTRQLTVDKTDAGLVGRLIGGKGNVEQFALQPYALRQVEEHLGIPAKYADRLQAKYPDILLHDMNELLHRDPSTQLVRTLDGNMRAFLSKSYRCIDNFAFAQAVLDAATQIPGVTVESSEVTESRLYIKVLNTQLTARVGFKDGWEMGKDHNFFDEITAAAVFSNSEIGAGKLWFRPGTHCSRCTNLAVMEKESMSRVHLGRAGSAGEDGMLELMSDRTKELTDAALWSQITDMTTAALDGRLFYQQVALLQGATQAPITGEVVKTMELVSEKFQFNQEEKGSIMEHLLRGGQFTKYGLHSAVTRYSQDVESYDRASELERIGGRIIELAPKDWQAIAQAA